MHTKSENSFGQQLKERLNRLNNDTFKAEFSTLSTRAKMMYLMDLDIFEYETFLNRWSEPEWKSFWQQLDPQEQEHLPKTKVIQKEMIRDVFYTYYLKTHRFPTFAKEKAPYPSDLQRWKQAYFDHNLPNEKSPITAKEIFIKECFFKKKLKLFDIP